MDIDDSIELRIILIELKEYCNEKQQMFIEELINIESDRHLELKFQNFIADNGLKRTCMYVLKNYNNPKWNTSNIDMHDALPHFKIFIQNVFSKIKAMEAFKRISFENITNGLNLKRFNDMTLWDAFELSKENDFGYKMVLDVRNFVCKVTERQYLIVNPYDTKTQTNCNVNGLIQESSKCFVKLAEARGTSHFISIDGMNEVLLREKQIALKIAGEVDLFPVEMTHLKAQKQTIVLENQKYLVVGLFQKRD